MDEPKTDGTACFHCGNTDLFDEHGGCFCLDCCLHICPICGRGSLFDDSDPQPCQHYLAVFICWQGDGEWDRLFSMEDLGPDSTQDSDWQKENIWPEPVWERAVSTLAAMSTEEKAQRFGPLHPVLDQTGKMHASDACLLLDIPYRVTYMDDSAFWHIFYTELGSDKAWERLRHAIEKYRQGLTWLERYAREWA